MSFLTSGHVMAHEGDGKLHFSLLEGILEEQSPVSLSEGRSKVLPCEDLLMTPLPKFPLTVPHSNSCSCLAEPEF